MRKQILTAELLDSSKDALLSTQLIHTCSQLDTQLTLELLQEYCRHVQAQVESVATVSG